MAQKEGGGAPHEEAHPTEWVVEHVLDAVFGAGGAQPAGPGGPHPLPQPRLAVPGPLLAQQLAIRVGQPAERNGAMESTTTFTAYGQVTGSPWLAIKCLLPPEAAGIVLGLGGSTHAELQAKSGAKIQLSKYDEYFPGTTDRILLLSGTLRSCLTALHLIVLRLHDYDVSSPAAVVQRASWEVVEHVRLLLPAFCCGRVIGLRGQTIHHISKASGGATLSFGPDLREDHTANERILTIAGALVCILRAIALVMDVVTSNPRTTVSHQDGRDVGSSSASGLEWWGNLPGRHVGAHPAVQHVLGAAPMPPLQLAHTHLASVSPAVYAQAGSTAAAALAPTYWLAPAAAFGGGTLLAAMPWAAAQPAQLPMPPATAQPQQLPGARAAAVAAPPPPPSRNRPTLAGPYGPYGQLGPMQQSQGYQQLQPHPQLQPRQGRQPEQFESQVELSIEIPDRRIGVIIGKNMETLQSLQQLLNVGIRLVPRAPSSSLRKVTIHGALEQVNMAHAVIMQRLASARPPGGSTGGAAQPPQHRPHQQQQQQVLHPQSPAPSPLPGRQPPSSGQQQAQEQQQQQQRLQPQLVPPAVHGASGGGAVVAMQRSAHSDSSLRADESRQPFAETGQRDAMPAECQPLPQLPPQ